jgi:hypothetical protein
VQKDRPGSKLNQEPSREGRSYVEVERGKIGAFVGELPRLVSFAFYQNGLYIDPHDLRSV